jgi:hypothetical protein
MTGAPPPAPNARNTHGEPYRPDRKYLSASNTLFLALKVFGYSLLGYLIIVLILGAIGLVFTLAMGGGR